MTGGNDVQGAANNQAVASSSYLPLPAQFNSTDDWNVYEVRLTQFFLAYNVTEDNRKAANILTSFSNEVFKVSTNLCFPNGPEIKTLKQFSPFFSIFAEHAKFYEAVQNSNDCTQDFVILQCIVVLPENFWNLHFAINVCVICVYKEALFLIACEFQKLHLT